MRMYRLYITFLLLFLTSCASYRIDDVQNSIRNSLSNQQDLTASSSSLIKKLENPNIYKKKDAVLKNLEKGTIYHFAGQYQESFQAFEDAELEIEEQYTKSVTRAIKSLLVNDTELAYDGEDYENIYLNTFKALNFIHLNDYEAALVEARRMTFKLENMTDKYKGVAEALSKKEHADEIDVEAGKADLQNSALSRYLSTVLFTKQGRPDNARIESEQLKSALLQQSSVLNQPVAAYEDLGNITNPRTYNVMILAFSGRSPHKTEETIRLYSDENDFYFKLALPRLKTFNSNVSRVRIQTSSGQFAEAPVIEHMDLVAKEIYKIKEPIIYARTFIRSLAKAIAGKAANDKAEKSDNAFLSALTEIATAAATEISEKADLRGWQTMPGKAHAATLQLLPGTHKVTVQYLSSSGHILKEELREVSVTKQPDELQLVETLYWN